MEIHAPLATRHSLLARLKDWDDQESWHDFFDTYWRFIYGVALKAGLGESEAQDVIQETMVAVARNLKNGQFDRSAGSFKRWLVRMVHWRISDQFEKRRRHQGHRCHSTSTETSTVERLPDPRTADPDRQWEEDWKVNLVQTAVDRLRTKVPPKAFQAFDLHVIKKIPAPTVARTVGMTTSQVYMTRFRLMKVVRAEIKRLEHELV